ncbi:hypothetical protein ASE19_00975 [Nocardioides sp. Root79]|nr:hypothetical protein ASE19_00975 [Nocardioides sp. Root79]KRC68548.1 hypothetical protein ASE20_16985 [Nocardioides sp. Root240]
MTGMSVAQDSAEQAVVITFNDLLLKGGVDPGEVKLLRHVVKGKQILEIWRSDRALFEEYQRRQGTVFFNGVSHAACFLVSRAGTEVFGGLYRVDGSTAAAPDDIDPLVGVPHGGSIYDLTREPAFAKYEDKLVVQWYLGGKHPGWWQWAKNNPKPIVEIATQQEQPFPGWLEFASPVDELDLLPRTWQEVLRSASGVYLLTDSAGKHYVGSAKGGDGFWGRWYAYRNGGTGGNVGLRGVAGPFTVAVLQTFDPGLSDQSVERVESLWKEKLGARLVGLNLN